MWRYLITGLLLVLPVLATAQQWLSCTPVNHPASRIVGGISAPAGEWPWQVHITIKVSKGELHCGGTLISPQWVLTASHCLNWPKTRNAFDPRQFTIGHGSHDRTQMPVQVGAAKLFTHPYFDPRIEAGMLNDIGLIKLAQPINAPSVQLASFNTDRAFGAPEHCAVVTGWGLTDNQTLATELQQVDVPLVDLGICATAFPGQIYTHHLCAGYSVGGKDACVGDSGGPLLVPQYLDRSQGIIQWIQVGIVSWGQDCAKAGKYGVYTRIAPYIAWIQDVTNRN